ncbi:MAG: DNA-3-methyladenine glycosylase I [Flaviflexus sp.]|nr:DNA-3-methyladenine glycosylase I [Flaviflexus sp.]
MDDKGRPSWASTEIERHYYDTEWGMPVTDEVGVFERLSLEVFQCGLAWRTVLTKREALRAAFADFRPDRIARFTAVDVDRLLATPGIIRNRRKIIAIIGNAHATLDLRETPPPGPTSPGRVEAGLPAFLWSYRERSPAPATEADIPVTTPLARQAATDLKAAGFSHLGPVTTYAAMSAIGIVNNHLAHSWRREPVARAIALVTGESQQEDEAET